MSLTTLYLPKMGESVMEAFVLSWLVQEGETVTEGQSLLEVSTDKVDAEIPSLCAGVVQKKLVQKGAVVPIGAPIALLETTQHTGEPLDSTTTPMPLHPCTSPSAFTASPSRPPLKLTPLAKKMVQAHAIKELALQSLQSHTKAHWITKKSVMDHLKKQPSIDLNKTTLLPAKELLMAGDEIIEMSRVRQLIAHRMVQSKQIAPHVTSFIRTDVTKIVSWRNDHQADFKKKYGMKLAYHSIFMTIIAQVLSSFPLLNAAIIDHHKIIKRKNINIGFAVSLPDGNLLVPVVKEVTRLSFSTLAQRTEELIHKARNGTISPDELTGATYTISNIGSFKNLMGTPIIVQPQVAILALGVIEKRPAVITTSGEAKIAIRDEMILSHSYDHRIIDGAIGGGFLQCLAEAFHSFSGITT